jgi:hypothetical protein
MVHDFAECGIIAVKDMNGSIASTAIFLLFFSLRKEPVFSVKHYVSPVTLMIIMHLLQKMEDICNISINNKNKVKDKRNAGATAWFSGKIPNHATSHRMVHEKISEPRDSASYGSAEIDAQKK